MNTWRNKLNNELQKQLGMYYNSYAQEAKEKFTNKVITITCPEEFVFSTYFDKFAIPVFLAGGITNCEEWQKVVIEYFKNNWKHERGIVFFNPRRDNFDVTNPNATVEQIEWEFKYINTHGVLFSMYFSNSQSPQPICFYEMGRALAKISYDAFGNQIGNNVFIATHKDFFRKQDVLIQSKLANEDFAAIEVENAEDYAKKLMEYVEENYNKSIPMESSGRHCCDCCKHFSETPTHGSGSIGNCYHSENMIYKNDNGIHKTWRTVHGDNVCKLFEEK